MEELEAKRQPCTILSRIVGYYAPVDNWNDSKISEWSDRVTFKIPQEVK